MLSPLTRYVVASPRLSTSARARSCESRGAARGPGETIVRSCCRYTFSTSAGNSGAMACAASTGLPASRWVPGVLGAVCAVMPSSSARAACVPIRSLIQSPLAGYSQRTHSMRWSPHNSRRRPVSRACRSSGRAAIHERASCTQRSTLESNCHSDAPAAATQPPPPSSMRPALSATATSAGSSSSVTPAAELSLFESGSAMLPLASWRAGWRLSSSTTSSTA